MSKLTRDQILQADDKVTEEVSVPEWNGEVTVRNLTGKERDEYEAGIAIQTRNGVKVNLAQARAKLLVKTIIDDKGERVFTEKDINALGDKSAQALQRVFEVASRLSGLSKEDVEELLGNSEEDQSDGSISS